VGLVNAFTRAVYSLATKLNPNWLHYSSYSDVPQAIRMNKSYKTYAKEGYKNSDTLYKCISYIIRNGAAIPPKLYTDPTCQKEIEKHPLLDKLNRPNPEQSGVQYREAVLGYKLLAGNSFQYSIRAGKSGPPDELWSLRPDRMQILIQPRKGIIGYQHEDMEQPIDASNIGHTKYWNPDDDDEPGMGMSPVEAASLNVDMQVAGKKWNLGLLQNGARPPGIWRIPVLMGKNEREKLEDKLNQKYAGAKSAGKSPLFDGGLDWKGTGLGPAEMDYLDSLKYNGGSIANIMNIAPQLVGDNSSTTYDNMKQAKLWSYTEAIFPELDDLYALWNIWLLPMYPDLANSTAFLYYDKQSVEVVQEVLQAQKDAQSQRSTEQYLNGVAMLNEARKIAGLPEVSGGDVFRIGAVLVPADKLEEYAEQSLTEPAAPPMPQAEPLDDGSQPPMPQDAQQQNNAGEKSRRFTKALDLETAEQKRAYAKSVEQQRERWYSEVEDRLKSYFASEQKVIVKAVESAALPETASIRAESALKKHSAALKEVLAQAYQDVSVDVGTQTLKELKAQAGPGEVKSDIDDFIAMFGTDLLQYLLTVAGQKITQINDTTLAQIQTALATGVAAGESIPKLAKRIDALYLDQIIPNRSTVIARGEVVSASNWSSQQAARRSGLTLKKVWLATEDSRTRPAHAEADGQEVDLDEPFEVGGEKLQYPGDPSGSAENIIQCRCTQFYRRAKSVEQDDENKLASRVIGREAYRDFMRVVLV
jgi:HK97 family phage portal protein